MLDQTSFSSTGIKLLGLLASTVDRPKKVKAFLLTGCPLEGGALI